MVLARIVVYRAARERVLIATEIRRCYSSRSLRARCGLRRPRKPMATLRTAHPPVHTGREEVIAMAREWLRIAALTGLALALERLLAETPELARPVPPVRG
jgi:hypothetical protein